MSDGNWIPSDEWETVVRNVPIPSIDLVVSHDGGIVLGKRTNEPAKGEWFVPGGRVHKHEQLEDAVHRIASEELGVEVEIREQLGVYEHFYDTADVPDVGGKHYIPMGFTVETLSDDLRTDDQHSTIRVFQDLPPDVHDYTAQYLQDSQIIDW